MSVVNTPKTQAPSHMRQRLMVWLALAAITATFALGARSWVGFFLAPDVGNGDPVRLFTQTDYPAIVIASRLVAGGKGAELYNLDAQRQEQARLVDEGYIALPRDDDLRYPYPYTPFIAVLMSPLAELSPLLGMTVWDLLNLAAFAGGLWYLLVSLSLSPTVRLLLLLGGLSSFPFIVNLEQGQSSGVVMLALGMGIGLLKRERDFQAGLALGLLALKVQWLPFVALVLIWKWRWKALAGLAATVFVLMVLTFAVLGTSWLPGFIEVLASAQSGSRELLLDPAASHGLLGGLVALLGVSAEGIARAANLAVMLVLAGLILYLFREPWQPRSARWDGKMALVLLGAMLTNMHLNTHDLSLLAIPACLGLSYELNAGLPQQMQRIWYALIWAAYLVPLYLFAQVFDWPIRLTTMIIAAMLATLMTLMLVLIRRRVAVA